MWSQGLAAGRKKKEKPESWLPAPGTRRTPDTHVIEGFGPGADPPAAVQTPEESVAEDVDHHGQRVNGGAVERQAVLKTLLVEER